MPEAPELHFDMWCSLVCGAFRTADEYTLKDLWTKCWRPQQAIDHLQKRRLFRKRRKDSVPFWESWKDVPKPRKARQMAVSGFELRCRIAEAIIAEIHAIRRHRLEDAELQFCQKLQRQCAAQLEERERQRRARKAERVARNKVNRPYDA